MRSREVRIFILFAGVFLALGGILEAPQAGTGEPGLLESGREGETIKVVIWLEDQPMKEIADQVRAEFAPGSSPLLRRSVTSRPSQSPTLTDP